MDPNQIDNVLKMAEAIDKYGGLVIGLAAFLVVGLAAIFIIFQRNQHSSKLKDNDFEKLFTKMQNQQQEVFDKLLQSAFKANQPELVPESISAAGAVQEQLKQVAAITKADRISVYAFHDGQRMMNGRHMIKFSCWSEFVMLGRFARIDKHRDVQVSRVQDMCNALLSEHRWESLTPEAINDTQYHIWEEDIDTQSIFAQSIYSAEGIIIGFVLLEYILSPIEPTWVERARGEIKKLSDKVSLVMDIDLN